MASEILLLCNVNRSMKEDCVYIKLLLQVWSLISQRISDALNELEKQTVANWNQTVDQKAEKAVTAPPGEV